MNTLVLLRRLLEHFDVELFLQKGLYVVQVWDGGNILAEGEAPRLEDAVARAERSTALVAGHI